MPPEIFDAEAAEAWLARRPRARQTSAARGGPDAAEAVTLLPGTCGLAVYLSARAAEQIAEAFERYAPDAEYGCGLFGTASATAITVESAVPAMLERSPESLMPDVGRLWDEGRRLEAEGLRGREVGYAHSHPNGPGEPSPSDIDFALRSCDVLGREYALVIAVPTLSFGWAAPAYAGWVVGRDANGRARVQRAEVSLPSGGAA